jgi:hypothetical protein
VRHVLLANRAAAPSQPELAAAAVGEDVPQITNTGVLLSVWCVRLLSTVAVRAAIAAAAALRDGRLGLCLSSHLASEAQRPLCMRFSDSERVRDSRTIQQAWSSELLEIAASNMQGGRVVSKKCCVGKVRLRRAEARTGGRDKLATVRVPIVPLAYGTTIRPSDCISENAPGPVGAYCCDGSRGMIGRWRAPPMVVRAPRAPLESRAPALLLRCEQRVASSAKAWRVR